MKYLSELNILDRRVLLRADFNVPLHSDGSISDDTRLRSAIPTLQYILDQGASLVLMSHLGRPRRADATYSLRGVAGRLQVLLNRPVQFAQSCVGEEAKQKSQSLGPKEVLLLENLRFFAEETAADLSFAEQLSQHGEVYVNDAFGTAHRAHASTVTIAQFFKEKGVGLLMEKEMRSLARILEHPKRPLLAIIGGAKVSDKIGLLTHLISKVDEMLIGGGMSHTFVCAVGGKVGSSLLEKSAVSLAKSLSQEAQEKGTQIHLPTDAIIAESVSNTATAQQARADHIPKGWKGLDIGKETATYFCNRIFSAKTVLWNGTMGVAELPIFSKGTESVAKALAEATQHKDVFSVVGGGDSVAAVKQLGLAEKMSHLSTGGGALLNALEGKGLAALKALKI